MIRVSPARLIKHMHDFHLADIIYKTILDYAAKNNLTKVTKAVIELGSVVEHGEEILAENLEFNIRMLAEGSPSHKASADRGGIADGLKVEISRGEGSNWTLKEIEGN